MRALEFFLVGIGIAIGGSAAGITVAWVLTLLGLPRAERRTIVEMKRDAWAPKGTK